MNIYFVKYQMSNKLKFNKSIVQNILNTVTPLLQKILYFYKLLYNVKYCAKLW